MMITEYRLMGRTAWSLRMSGLAAAVFLWMPAGFAGSIDQCQNSATKDMNDCSQEKSTAAQNNGAASVNGGNISSASGYSDSVGGNALSNACSQITANNKNAAAQCAADKQNCDSACDPSQFTDPSQRSLAKLLMAKCDQSIQPTIDALNASAASTTGCSPKAAETANQTPSAPQQQSPPPQQQAQQQPQPPPSSSTTPSATSPSSSTASTAPTTPTSALSEGTASTATGGASGSSCVGSVALDCITQNESSCTGKSTSPECEQFSRLYCQPSSFEGPGNWGAVQPASGITGSNSTYCQGYQAQLANSFCQQLGNSACPSCSQIKPGTVLPSNCANDPAYSNPQVAQSLNQSGVVVSSAGGSGGGTGNVGLATGGKGSSVGEAEGEGTGAGSGGGDGGGWSGYGGGGGSGDSYGGRYSRLPTLYGQSRSLASNGAATKGEFLASDVENRLGPNVFKISSAVILNRCHQGKMMHCGPGSQ